MMTKEDILRKNGIYFERIQEGFEKHQSETKKLSMRQAEELFLSLWERYGAENVYVDFYYFHLPEEAREKIDTLLSEEEKLYIKQLPHEKGQLFFHMEEMLLKIIVKLNAKEMLFSTVYITGEEPSTWWGNYGEEYVVFTR